MKAVIISLLTVVLAACHPSSKTASSLYDARTVEPLASGVLHGKTRQGEACSIEVISYGEKRHPEIGDSGDREYTDVEKTVELRLDFQHDQTMSFKLKSYYNTMWDAFESNYLTGDHELAEDRFEHVKLYLNHENKVAAVDYYRDPSHTIMGVSIGDKQSSCYFRR